MSRSYKHKKGIGVEYWSARPGNPTSKGKEAKYRTHRLERINDKKICKNIED